MVTTLAIYYIITTIMFIMWIRYNYLDLDEIIPTILVSMMLGWFLIPLIIIVFTIDKLLKLLNRLI
jgi:hypothetical protein